MTGGDIPIGDFSYLVSTDLSANQFYAVYLTSGTGGLAVCPTGNYGCLGILQDNPNGSSKNTVGAVREIGHSKAWVDTSNIVAGSPLKISGTAGILTLGSVGTDTIVAIACETNSSTSSIIEVALTARTAQGTSSRSGQLSFDIPIAKLATTGTVYSAMELGFVGTLKDIYAVVTSACSATTSASAALTIKLGASGTTSVGSLAIPVANLIAATVNTFGSVIASTGTTTSTFAATDKISVTVTQGSTTFGVGDTGYITLYVVYN